VVDDGSADNSRQVIERYGKRIISVFKENGGQASAFNAGFQKSHGDIVMFLDSDDLLLAHAVENVVATFSESEVVKAHWSLWVIDEKGARTGTIKEPVLPEGDFRRALQTHGPMTELTLPSAPTSGNAYSRKFLQQVLPMPEAEYKISPDAYLFGLAPAFGLIRRVAEPQSCWRFHGGNASSDTTFDKRLHIGVADYDQQVRVLERFFRRNGVGVDVKAWRSHSWWPRIQASINEVTALVQEGGSFILVDQDLWGTDAHIAGRRRIPFLEHEGQYWGPPADDQLAIEEFERLQRGGASVIAFAWPAFWWLDHYAQFHQYLRSKLRCVLQSNDLVVFKRR
jgi:glycosyltransferase involved in cell wall biosynthesis